MDKETRTSIERATQRARRLLEEDFADQLEGEFDVQPTGVVAVTAGGHLDARRVAQRERIVASIEHKRSAGMGAPEAVADYLRDAAFTTLNRFVALKMLEARELLQECISKGEDSAGYREFCGLAPGLLLLPDSTAYRLYIESLFDELSTEVKVLFDRRDPASVLWPRRATFEALLALLNSAELAAVWGEDETIGWVYQYFNGADERRKMREASQAPRNSRELAVRNQFFTPRYVVQFLTDNTLGHIWYEMRSGNTALADRCKYMVRKTGEEYSPRPKKDPRDLRVLDPACGSGHFLLYAFDLLLAIYEEAYSDPDSPRSEATGKPIADDYSSIAALRNAVPGLVLAHNLYGVDIDPRCAQIAQLALWMRAQKAYRDFRVGRADRAQIRRSNIVVAEPLVADEQIAKEFVARLGDAALGGVFKALVDSLNLAGDMGLLLRVEQLVARQAQRGKTGDLFAPPEDRIRAALARFVGEDGGRTNTRRRLFADDAAHGVALLGVAEKKFDAVLMNPPFGAGSMRAKAAFDQAYPRSRNDIYAAFVERGIELLAPHGRLGAITSRTGFFLSSFRKWREDVVLSGAPPFAFADLGLGVMDAALVEAAAYCLEKQDGGSTTRTTFIRALEEVHRKDAVLKAAIDDPAAHSGRSRFEVAPKEFRSVPGSPFAYWVSPGLRQLFGSLPPFEAAGRSARQGLATADDFRFVRLWWEIPSDEANKWRPYSKGGRYSPFYFDPHLVVNWADKGSELSAYAGSVVRNSDDYFRPGLTWPRRTKSDLSFRIMPAGCVFGDKGPAAFVQGDVPEDLLAILGIATSKVFRSLVEFQLAAAEPTGRGGVARSYEVGVIQRTPLPPWTGDVRSRLAALVQRCWSLRWRFDTHNETSHAFVQPAGATRVPATTDPRVVDQHVCELQREIDEEVLMLYGVTSQDFLSALTQVVPLSPREEDEPTGNLDDDEDSESDEADSEAPAIGSWLVGLAFERFVHTQSSGEVPPREPMPFAPLPSRSPAMGAGPAAAGTTRGVLVDDVGHTDDIVAHVRTWGERCSVATPRDLREWLARKFFQSHIKMYSKSRRKAPIYWQLATPSASYSVWLYAHALSKDTLFRVQNDFVAPKLAHEVRRLEAMSVAWREGATPNERKALASQEAFVEELRALLEEVKRVAPLWNPNLDDGVTLTMAPLWRLVPQHKPWQKELKGEWDELVAGKYGWSHLAMHLWPERVVPKCATDRSFAISHGLEEVFWVEGSDAKWTARKAPTRPIEELVRERTSAAVKAALKSLVEAPVTRRERSGPGRGGKASELEESA